MEVLELQQVERKAPELEKLSSVGFGTFRGLTPGRAVSLPRGRAPRVCI